MAQQQQHEKSQKQFETFFADGMSLYQANNNRAAADKLLQAVHAAPVGMDQASILRLLVVPSSKLEGSTSSMTQTEIDAITDQFIENENEPAHFRALAACFVGAHYAQPGCQMNMNTAAEHFREALDVIPSSPKEGENRQVLHHPHSPLKIRDSLGSNDVTLKSIL